MLLILLFTAKMNRLKVFNRETYLELVLNRSPGKPLITFSNHNSCMDDPFIWGMPSFSLSRFLFVIPLGSIFYALYNKHKPKFINIYMYSVFTYHLSLIYIFIHEERIGQQARPKVVLSLVPPYVFNYYNTTRT